MSQPSTINGAVQDDMSETHSTTETLTTMDTEKITLKTGTGPKNVAVEKVEAKEAKGIVFEAWTIKLRKKFFDFDGPFCILFLPFWKFSIERGVDLTVKPAGKEQSAALAGSYNAHPGSHNSDLTYRIRKLELQAQSEVHSLLDSRRYYSSGSWRVVSMTETLEDRAGTVKYRRGEGTGKMGIAGRLNHWWEHFPYRHRWMTLELLLEGTPSQEGDNDFDITTDPWDDVTEDITATKSQDVSNTSPSSL